MGWSSGSDIAEVIEKILLNYVPKNKLKKEAEKALEALEDQDWDVQDEVGIFDYLTKQKMLDEDNVDDEYVEEFKADCAKYKKKFGF